MDSKWATKLLFSSHTELFHRQHEFVQQTLLRGRPDYWQMLWVKRLKLLGLCGTVIRRRWWLSYGLRATYYSHKYCVFLHFFGQVAPRAELLPFLCYTKILLNRMESRSTQQVLVWETELCRQSSDHFRSSFESEM